MNPWLVLRGGDELRWGGDLRRRYLLDVLAERTAAQVSEEWSTPAVRTRLQELRGPRWKLWRGPARVAATELLPDRLLRAVREHGIPTAVDYHDDQILQNDALGVGTSPELAAQLRIRNAANLGAFERITVPSAGLARVADLPLDRVIVAGNGTDPTVIRPESWPSGPAIGFVSGAAPRRGIEALIEAARRIRTSIPDVRLLLWLAATGDASRAYLDGLRADTSGDPWIEIGQVTYDRFGTELGRTTVLCIPTPAHRYWDAVAPLKLFDGFASGRPTVTTPRVETAALVTRHEAGLVAGGDDAEALAACLARLLGDADLARRLGANARLAAEREHDWRIIGARLADELLAPPA